VVLAFAVLILFGTRHATSSSVSDLGGTYPATVAGEPAGVVQLPGLFANQGLPASGKVSIDLPLVRPAGAAALWFDHLQYAAEVRLDGELIAVHGDPAAIGGRARSTSGLLVVLPPGKAGTRHTLTLDIVGDYGSGGVIGRLLLGDVTAVTDAARHMEVDRLTLAVALALLALLPLAVATRSLGPNDSWLYFGLFTTCLAALSFLQTDTAHEVLGNASLNLRLRRLFGGPLAPLALCYIAVLVDKASIKWEHTFLGLSICIGLGGMLAPDHALHLATLISDATLVIGLPWLLFLLALGMARAVPGAFVATVLAFTPLALGVVSELLLTHGFRSGSSHLTISMALFVAGSGAALLIRVSAASNRHRRLVAESKDGIVIVQPDGRIHDANPTTVALLNQRPIGSNLLEWLHEEDRPVLNAHLAQEVPSGRTEFRMHTGEGERTMEAMSTSLGDSTVLLTLRDVTDRRSLDKGMLHAARMETVAVLLGGIAHDFNNMLGTLLAHVGLLQVTLDDEPALERLGKMETTIDRASQLTRRLLTVARGTGSELGAVDLGAVCRGAIELVEPTLGTGIDLVSTIADDLPPVLGDPGDLEQVIVNLLVNGRDALQGEGRLRLVARKFSIGAKGRGVAVMVEDDGPGVSAAMTSKIFQPFVTTKGRGTGLGLAVASQILRDHHGRIWYEERPGGGSRFLMALRHADTIDEAPAPLPLERQVLLVEDEEVLLLNYTTALRQAGYAVVPYSKPLEASRWLLTHRPDILITDVVMEGMNGLDLAKQCDGLYPDVPILVVSGFIPEENMSTLLLGAWHHLHKPVRNARLVATVGRLRRRAERAARGELDITKVAYLFPPLEDLTAPNLGFDD